MASAISLLPRHQMCIVINPKSTGVVAARGNAPNAHIGRTFLKSPMYAPKSTRLDTRAFYKNKSWDLPATESLDEETAELLDRYAATFEEADTDNDGLLQRSELRTILERVAGGSEATPLHWLLEEDLDKIFSQYDKNGDNAINRSEFMKLAHDNVFLTKELSDYRAAFSAVDINKDGFLGPTELISVLSKVGSPMKSYDNIVRLMNKYDTDRNGRMDFGEFLRLCRYEQALPLDDILEYAAVSGNNSGTSSNDDDGTVNGKSATVATSNVISATSLASTPATEISKTAATASEKTTTPRRGATGKENIVVAISNEEYFNGIFECNKEKLVVVMGSLTWCRPCKRFNPVYQRMAAAYPHVVFLHLNGNDSEETKRLFKHKLKIRATPSFLFFRNGVVVDSCSGANPSRFESHLRALLKEGEMPEKSLYELIDVEEDNAKVEAKAM